MSLQSFQKSKFFKFLTNKYVFVGIAFGIWMLFFDENSWLNHRKMNIEIEKLKKEQEYYKSQIEKDQKTIDLLKDADKVERFARETYKMKRKDEDIYIIAYDTIKK